jgi:hypothetical protein
MKRFLTVVFVGFLVSAITCGNVWAQASAQISGTVRDQSGAVLPGVEITATQTDTGIIRTTITNETGSYTLPNLAIGPYRLEAALPGFRTFAQTGIVLQVNSSPVINPILDVGQVSEQVEVQANAVQVETRSVGIGQVMENERILELPLNGRNAAELILLSGAAVSMGTTSGRQFPDRIAISTGGSLGFGTHYELDGIRHVDSYDGIAMPLPFPDALQEFKVESSGLSAQNGRGSSVGAVTKSGTNEFHGSLFEFVRNDLFNARNFFAIKGSTLKRNQFGGTFGGPIMQNKLFFFGGYQGTILRQDPQDTQAFVPTAAMLNGDFTTITSPACVTGGRQINLGAPFQGNRVDPGLFSKAALNIASKLPKTSDPCGLFVFGRREDQNDGQIVSRVDYQLNERHSLFGRYVWNTMDLIHPFTYTPDNILNTTNAGYDNHAHAASVGSTYLLGSNIVNAFRVGVTRTNQQRLGAEFFEFKDVGINVYNYVPKFSTFSVTNGFSIGGGSQSDSNFTTTAYTLSNDVSWTSTTHQIGFGVIAVHSRGNINAWAASGQFSFDGTELGHGLAEFMLGRPTNFLQGDANRLYARNTQFSLYGQDTWKLTPRLTMNYGLRWVPVFPMKDMREPVPSVIIFDFDRFVRGERSTVFRNAPAGLRFHGDADFPLSNNEAFKSNWWNFGPRLGFAWDVQGDGRTSVRASYGLTYEEFPLQMRHGESIGQPPWGGNISLPSPTGGLDNPWRDVPGGNPFPYALDVNTPFPTVGGVYQSQRPDIVPTYIGSWNLSVQRQVAPDWLVSASYMGSQTIHLWAQIALNPGVYYFNGTNTCTLPNGQTISGPSGGNQCSTNGNLNQRRLLSLSNRVEGQGIGRMGEYVFGGTQNYNGMLLSVQHRPRSGVAVTGNYTYSHCIGDYSGRSSRGVSLGNAETYQVANDRRLDRANCVSDVRHALNLTTVAETPQFANRTLRWIGSGWRLSGIYRRSTDTFLTVTSGTNRALNDISDTRPNRVGGVNMYKDTSKGPLTQYLDPAAFAKPDLGTLGNLGRVNIKAPGTWQFDTALSRIFRFRENQSLEFRAEAYNMTNSFRPGNPNTSLNSSTFGQIRTSRDPRITQFALKYIF